MNHRPFTDKDGEEWGNPGAIVWVIILFLVSILCIAPVLLVAVWKYQCSVNIDGLAPEIQFICSLLF